VVVEDYVSNPDLVPGIATAGRHLRGREVSSVPVQVDASIFNLSALLFVRSFVLKLKPTYNLSTVHDPKEIVRRRSNTTDEISYSALLSLSDSDIERYGGAHDNRV